MAIDTKQNRRSARKNVNLYINGEKKKSIFNKENHSLNKALQFK